MEIGIAKFCLSLYSNSRIPRNTVQLIVDGITQYSREFQIPIIKKRISEILKDECSPDIMRNIETILNQCSNPFENLDTEYKRFKYFEKLGVYIPPQTKKISVTTREKRQGNKIARVEQFVTLEYIPLKSTLKLFLEKNGVFVALVRHMKELYAENGVLSNYIQGAHWKRKRASHGNRFYIPLFFFSDAFQTGDPFSPHTGDCKIEGTYVSIPCLPPHLSSKLQSVFLSSLCYASDKHSLGNAVIFRYLIDEFNDLKSNGIIITVESKEYRVYFECCLPLGDNLGLNGLLGLVECFRAHYFCRICKVPFSLAQVLTVEDESLLRNETNYAADLALNNSTKTGLKKECAFNRIDGFKFPDVKTGDMMHDVREGTAKYLMGNILYDLIINPKTKCFSLEILNERIELFNYNVLDQRIPTIALDDLKKKKIKMSAAEMSSLIRYFGVLVGDLVPQDNEIWQLWKSFRIIFDILSSPRHTKVQLEILEFTIQKHLKLYIKLYGPLKPKHHFFLHYLRIIIENGPMIHFECMKYESFHRGSKLAASSASGTQNLLKTMAIKNQLKFAHLILSLDLSEKFEEGKSISFHQSIIPGQFAHILNKDSIKCLSHVEINGTKYSKNTVVVVDTFDEKDPNFGEIVDIYIADGEIYFVMRELQTLYLDNHYRAYCVKKFNNKRTIRKYNSLPKIVMCSHIVTRQRAQYIIPRHIL